MATLETKHVIRQQIQSRIAHLPLAKKLAHSTRIRAHLKAWLCSHPGGHMGSFFPQPTEPAIWPLIQTLPTTVTIYLPKYAPTRGCYEWGLYKEPLLPGKFNIPEPFTVAQPHPHIHVALVPALGIDKNGNRLGWGHGFYDRLLSIHTPVRIGVIFSDQECDTLPIDDWDIPMTHIVTEHGLRKIPVPPH